MANNIGNRLAGRGWRSLSLLACLLVALPPTACRHKDALRPEDLSDSAVQKVSNAHIWRSEHGRLQVSIDAPYIEKYDKPKDSTLYLGDRSRRVRMQFFNEERQVRAMIEADSAFSVQDSMWATGKKGGGNEYVVVIDYTKGDTIYLEDLHWRQSEDRIYSNHHVIARNGKRITEGDGFTSDQRMENMTVLRQRGTIEIQD